MNRCRPYRFVHPLRGCGDMRGDALYRDASPDGDKGRNNQHLGARHVPATMLPQLGDNTHILFTATPPRCDGSTTIFHSPFFILNWSHTFSAKERDSETGLSYFGARYYSSDLSIWLSVDPISDKYPSLSPYVYCANNPIKLVDPNGEDYEIVIKGNNLIVKANYYTSDANKKDLQEALDLWNNQNGFSYVTGKGKNKKVYNIRFELTIAEGNFTDEKSTMGSENFHSGIDNFLSYSDNIFNENKEPINGEATNNVIHIRPEASIRTIAHEVGHTLGIGDWTIPGPESEDHGQLMTSGGSSDVINRSHVATILSNKGYKTNSFTWGVIINRNKNFFPQSKKMSGTVKFN